MRTTSVIGRTAAIAALLIATAGVAVALLGGGGGHYKVKALFQNASQIVKGNLVQVSGKPIGKVTDIKLTDDGQAELTLDIDKDFAPLRRGTQATVRQSSLSGIANRYIDLRLAPASAPKIDDGGVISQAHTTTAVDLDQLFNVFGPRERRSLSGVIRGSATQYAGRGRQTNEGWRYLNPSLAATSRLFRELNRDTPLFERFVVESSKLVTDVADRREDLAGLIDNLATATGAIGRRDAALADAVHNLPPFMRRANTTFVNLRATLDDLRPLIDESKPVAKKLRPFVRELRGLAEGAQPTLRDLSRTFRRPGANNDLIEATRSTVPLRNIAVGPVQANGKQREGSFPASTKALEGALPAVSFFRPYSVDLTGWFNDFSTSGLYDALGGASRASPHFNAFAITGSTAIPLPPDLRDDVFGAAADLSQNDRCPGAIEGGPDRGEPSSPFKPSPDFECDQSQHAVGP